MDSVVAFLDGLAERLRSRAQSDETFDVAQFQFLGFDEIAEAYGERWPVVSERVRNTAVAFIRKRVGPRDEVIAGSDGFLVIYGDDDSAAAKEHAEQVKTELNEFFLGANETRPVARVGVRHERTNARDLMQSIAKLKPTPPATQPATDTLLGWSFSPVWDVRREAVATYFVNPLFPEGSAIPGYRYDLADPRGVKFSAIDAAALRKSEEVIAEQMRSGRPSLIAVRLHISSLLDVTSRGHLMRIMDECDPELAKYRVVNVSGGASNLPRLYLGEIFQSLRLRVRHVAFGMAWDDAGLRSVMDHGPSAIGFSLPPHPDRLSARVSESDLLAIARRALGVVQGGPCTVFVDGPVDATTVQGLKDVGVHQISSSLVWDDVDAPGGMYRWQSERLAG